MKNGAFTLNCVWEIDLLILLIYIRKHLPSRTRYINEYKFVIILVEMINHEDWDERILCSTKKMAIWTKKSSNYSNQKSKYITSELFKSKTSLPLFERLKFQFDKLWAKEENSINWFLSIHKIWEKSEIWNSRQSNKITAKNVWFLIWIKNLLVIVEENE